MLHRFFESLYAMPIAILFAMSLPNTAMADGVGAPACQEAAQAASTKCGAIATLVQERQAAHAAVAGSAVSGNQSILDGSTTQQQVASATGTDQLAGYEACKTLLTTCKSTCTQAYNDVPTTSAGNPTKAKADYALIKESMTQCNTTDTTIAKSLGVGSLSAFWAANKAAIVAGAVGLAGGYMLGKSNGSKDGGSSSGSGGDGSDDGSGGDGDGEVDCADTANAGNVSCRDDYLSTCSADLNGAGCGDFFASYCESGHDGAGSALCARAESTSFCQDGTQANSPACTWLSSMTHECTQNLGAPECLPQYASRSDAEAACADASGDPLCNAILNEGLLVSGPSGGVPQLYGGNGGVGATGSQEGTTGTLMGASRPNSGGVTMNENGSTGLTARSYSNGSSYNGGSTQYAGTNYRGDRNLAALNLPGDIQGVQGGSVSLFQSQHQHFQQSCQQNSYVGCHAQSAQSYGGGSR